MKVSVWSATVLPCALALLSAGCGKSVESVAAAATPGIPAGAPPQQQKFCQTILKWNEEFARRNQALEKESNPIRKEQMQKQWNGAEDEAWDELFALVGPSGEFAGWRGKVYLPRNLDQPGKYAVGFNVCTMRNGLAGEGIDVGLGTAKVAWPARNGHPAGSVDTLIPEGSPLGQSLGALNVDKEATASGNFIWATPDMQKCCWHGVNERFHFLPGLDQPYTAIRTPYLMVRFTSITQAR
jgi:hypothetical protein